jgi:hypothetical protein
MLNESKVVDLQQLPEAGQTSISGIVSRMDAAVERTGMYLPRFLEIEVWLAPSHEYSSAI